MPNKEIDLKSIINSLPRFNLSTMEGVKCKCPIADGSFIQGDMVQRWDDEKWQSEFKYLKEVNMHYLVMGTSITEGNTIKTLYPTKIPGGQMEFPEVDIVDMCLRNAEKANIKVFLGINFNTDWWKKGGKDPKWLYDQMDTGNIIADELYNKYHNKYPNAFYGWYWVYEVDNLNFRTKNQFSVLAEAININLKHLKEKKHRLPFMLSPFMNSNYGKPKEYAENWAYLFKNTELGKGDVFCPQDSVGGGGLNIHEVEDWFSELKKAVDTKPGLLFWANVETFNHKNWSSAPLNRFIKQMEIVHPYVSNIITFSYSHYYSPNNIDIGFHSNYLDYVRNCKLEKQKPSMPKDLKVQRVGLNKFLITWKASEDNNGIYGYNLYRDGRIIYSTNVQRVYGGVKKGILMKFIDKCFLKGKITNITYAVRAVDFAGNLSTAAQVTIRGFI